MASQKIKIAFDLDGIFVDRPPFIPKKLLELLFCGWSCQKDKLCYRFPKTKFEQQVRQLSHFYLLRPPINHNVQILKRLAQSKKYQIYLVSSRYSFLQKETHIWLVKRKINRCFDKVCLNLLDRQPHIFKEKILKKLKPIYYFEDDRLIVNYLRKKIPDVKIIFAGQKILPLPHSI